MLVGFKSRLLEELKESTQKKEQYSELRGNHITTFPGYIRSITEPYLGNIYLNKTRLYSILIILSIRFEFGIWVYRFSLSRKLPWLVGR